MKDKIIYLILGILIGAVITAGCFLLFSKNNNDRGMMERGDRQEMGNFVGGPKGNEIGEPPQMDSQTTTSSNTTL